MTRTTIVVPVYADWSSLKDCLESLIRFVSSADKVMVVNDCGPDVDKLEKNILSQIDNQNNFTYYRNPKNLGFVGTCNRAVLELDKTNNDILLLNSDTKVTRGFLEELKDVLYSKSTIGSVSPRSNNATIATVPLSMAAQKGIEPQKSYKIFKRISPLLPKYTVVPTTHGFCMLIKRSIIKKYGLFDAEFGKGYGEEVDFCQRIAKKGYQNVLANHAYVYHQEARSFTLETKQRLLDVNDQIIWKRYPTYRKVVREYMDKAQKLEGEAEIRAGVKSKNYQLKTQRAKTLIKRILSKPRR